MKFDASDLNIGLSNGLKRAQLYFKTELSSEDAFSLNTKVGNVFQAFPGELNARFVILFAELAGLAETSRRNYGEPLLEEDELKLFLGQAVPFFNSFTHP